ncbi:MAG: hypothetical protein WDA75_07220 [Candidatus Latescibacterota bacterium]|jgi:hypothetical protein
MNFNELIKNWHAKAVEQQDCFSAFVFEYLAFIAFLKKNKFQTEKPDRRVIQLLKQDTNIMGEYLKKIVDTPTIQSAWDVIKVELNYKPLKNVSENSITEEEIKWWNCSHSELNLQKPAEALKTNGVIHSLDDWENMVEFWYSIRNNLFHGGKDPEDDRDQRLAENGYKTLRPLVEILLK